GAVGFSSWAFVLLTSPVSIAYGMVGNAPWYFYVVVPLYFFGFVLLPGSLGALLCLLVINFVPRRRKELLGAAAVAVLVVALLVVSELAQVVQADVWDRDLLHRLLDRFSFARSQWMPTHWMTRGLQAAARTDLVEMGYYLGLIWSNGLFLYVIASW